MAWKTLWSQAKGGFVAARSDRWCNSRWLVLGIVLGIVLGTVAALVAPAIFTDRGELETGELVIMSGRDDSAGGQRRALIDQWNDLHPHNRAQIIELSGRADEQRNSMVTHAQSGNGGVDIYNLDVTWTAEFADQEYIRPIAESGVDTAGFLENPLKTCHYEGKLWALPFNSAAGLLYYRADLIPKPPGGWPQITNEIDRVFAEQPDRSPALEAGYTGQLANYEGLTVNALEAIWAAGGDAVDNDGNVVVDKFNNEVRTGLDRLRPRSRNPQIILPESLESDETTSMQAFQDRRVLFMRNWPVAYRNLDPPADKEGAPGQRLQFGVTPLPGPSALGGQNLSIAANTAKPRAAEALIQFLTDARSQQILFERGGFAATREVVYRDAVVNDRYRYAQDLLRAIKSAKLRPVTPHYERFSEIFRNGVDEALRNGDLPKDFANQLSEALKGR